MTTAEWPDKSTLFSKKRSINIRGKLFRIDRPWIMGILNVTDDSFYSASRTTTGNIQARANLMLEQGADILDIGAASSRPGASLIMPEQELQRLIPALKTLRKNFPDTIISVDTYNAQTAQMAIDYGADMINDISAGRFDTELLSTISQYNIPYVLMHSLATPEQMQQNPVYNHVIKDILLDMSKTVFALRQQGVKDIIIDPGIGFGKTAYHNFEILNNLNHFHLFGLPVLVGLSRKSFIYKTLLTSPENALTGTIALHTFSLLKGADILRVHDVKEAKECVEIVKFLQF